MIDGCPKLLFSPTPIIAILGFTLERNSIVEDVFEPWCAIFKMVDFNISWLFLYFSNIAFSAFSSISPVNSIENLL